MKKEYIFVLSNYLLLNVSACFMVWDIIVANKELNDLMRLAGHVARMGKRGMHTGF